jgi:HSP20 family protein
MALLMRPEPFSHEFERLMSTVFGDLDWAGTRRWVPAVDLVEADDHYLLQADLPGLTEEDVKVEVEDGVLTISGERKNEHRENGRGWHRVERTYGTFRRSFTLPDGVDADRIEASFDRGVLSVRVPKPEERKPRRIEITSGNGSRPELEG